MLLMIVWGLLHQELKPGTLVRGDDPGSVSERHPEQGKGMIIGEDCPAFCGMTVEIQEEEVPLACTSERVIRHPAGDLHTDILGILKVIHLLICNLGKPSYCSEYINLNASTQISPIEAGDIRTGEYPGAC